VEVAGGGAPRDLGEDLRTHFRGTVIGGEGSGENESDVKAEGALARCNRKRISFLQVVVVVHSRETELPTSDLLRRIFDEEIPSIREVIPRDR